MAQDKTNKLLGVIPEEELLASGHRACAGCGVALAARHALKAAGKNTIVVNATGCLEVFTTPYPESAWKIPWVHGAFENAAAIASGVESALKSSGNKDDTKVLVFAGDGGTFDIGLQALSGAFERGHDICYVCFDNEAYMNTGIQRSGSTQKYTSTTTTPYGKLIHGKMQFKKNFPFLVAAHENAYVATANIAFVNDFINKVRKGLANKGPSYIQVFCPCTPGWKIQNHMSIEIAKAAVETRATPLFEIEKGIMTLNRKIDSPKPLTEYLKNQGRFKKLSPEEIDELKRHIDGFYDRLVKLDGTKMKVW